MTKIFAQFDVSPAPPKLIPVRAAFCESNQISKQNTSATHFFPYNLATCCNSVL